MNMLVSRFCEGVEDYLIYVICFEVVSSLGTVLESIEPEIGMSENGMVLSLAPILLSSCIEQTGAFLFEFER